MSITEGYRTKIRELEKQKEQLTSLGFSNPDITYLTVQLDGQIHDLETRIRKMSGYTATVQCHLCEQWFPPEMESQLRMLNQHRYCPHCLKTVSQVMTSQEAEELWGLTTGTIKQDRRRGKLKDYEELGLIRKSGNYWLVHSCIREYYQKQ